MAVNQDRFGTDGDDQIYQSLNVLEPESWTIYGKGGDDVLGAFAVGDYDVISLKGDDGNDFMQGSFYTTTTWAAIGAEGGLGGDTFTFYSDSLFLPSVELSAGLVIVKLGPDLKLLLSHLTEIFTIYQSGTGTSVSYLVEDLSKGEIRAVDSQERFFRGIRYSDWAVQGYDTKSLWLESQSPTQQSVSAPEDTSTSTSSSTDPITGEASGLEINLVSQKPEAILLTPKKFGKNYADQIIGFEKDDSIMLNKDAFQDIKTTKITIARSNKAVKKAMKGLNKTNIVFDSLKGYILYDQNLRQPGLGSGGEFAIVDNPTLIGKGNLYFY